MSTIRFAVVNKVGLQGRYSELLMARLHRVAWPQLQRIALDSIARQCQLLGLATKYRIERRDNLCTLYLNAWKHERISFFHCCLALGIELPDGTLV